MKEVYLTKVERKTIFTKSLIYVIIMFIISDLTQVGPFYINFIPWLYILGVIASIKGIDKILTCIIGGFTVFISCTILQKSLDYIVLTHTVFALVQIIFGILTGKIIYEFILEHRLVKFIRRSKKTLYIVMIVLLTAVSIGISSMLYGDVFSYFTSKKNLDRYLSNTYNVQDYKIKQVIFNRSIIGKYYYKIEIDSNEMTFVPINNKEFKELNKQDRINKLSDSLNNRYGKIINEMFLENEFSQLDKMDISFKIDYSKISLNPDRIIMSFNVSTDNLNQALEEISSIINEVTNKNIEPKITDLIINVNNKVLNIKLEDGIKVTKEYISQGLNIEDLDEHTEDKGVKK